MFEQPAMLSRALAGAAMLPGGLLAWSLMLAFLAVFLAVAGFSGVARPATPRRRLNDDDTLLEAAKPGGARRALSGRSRAPSRHEALIQSLAWALALPLLAGAALWAGGKVPSWTQGLYFGGTMAVLGWIVPGLWRGWRERRRCEALRLGFPDVLDMMVVCVEAGLGLDAALNRVAVEIAPAHPPLAEELTRIGRELRAGRERGAVLRGFARRSGLAEIASFATLLIQSEALGTGIARSLRVQAEEMRAARMLRAEEQAHTLPVKLTAPLVICVLPAMIAVVLLPGVIAILRDILPNLGR